MINCAPMSRFYFNIIILLSISALLVTSVGNTFGYAWCYGDDGRTRVEQASVNGCADRQGECQPLPRNLPVTIAGPDSDHSPQCSDVLIGSDEVVVTKRSDKSLKLPIVSSPVVLLFSASDTQPNQFFTVLSPKRVSQAILAHRTVVLLN
jgi:hypothetical protein